MRVTVLLPLMDETSALRQTVAILLSENAAAISQILILASPRTTPAALDVAAELQAAHADLIETRCQRRPYLGGAIRDGFDWSTGTHVLLMASDLETDPALVKHLIAAAAAAPEPDIVTATRWARPGAFVGYHPVKRALNRVFQQSFALLYGTRLSDLTFGFRIFRAEWVKTVAWEELRHPLLLETLLKPLRLGARVVEIPAVWRARAEGESHNSFLRNFVYFRIAVRTRLRRRSRLRIHLHVS